MAKPRTTKPASRPAVQGLGPWADGPGTYIAGQAWIDEADKAAIAAERRWGAGRLRLLVGADLRERFDRQRYLMNAAIWHGDLEAVRREAGRMVNAWKALDRAAEAAGAQACRPEVWEIALADGRVLVLARSADDLQAWPHDGRAAVRWTLEEVARLIAGTPFANACKAAWPGATVEAVRPSLGDALQGLADTAGPLDDPLPF